jgi:signal transduction histidine kinase
VLIAVEDTGIGIAPRDQAQVFERFGHKRHDVTVSEQGTGLGLAIVKGYTEAHGGEVTLDSAPGVGTRVAVRLPAARVHRIGMRAAE